MTTAEEALSQRADWLLRAKGELLEGLVSLRKRHHLTQHDVAERMNVSQPTVAAFEHYDANPTLGSVIRYAMAVEATLQIAVSDDCGQESHDQHSSSQGSAPRAR